MTYMNSSTFFLFVTIFCLLWESQCQPQERHARDIGYLYDRPQLSFGNSDEVLEPALEDKTEEAHPKEHEGEHHKESEHHVGEHREGEHREGEHHKESEHHHESEHNHKGDSHSQPEHNLTLDEVKKEEEELKHDNVTTASPILEQILEEIEKVEEEVSHNSKRSSNGKATEKSQTKNKKSRSAYYR